MRFLKLQKTGVWRDGTVNRTPLVVDAPRKFAPDHARTLRSLSKRQCQLFIGAHDSGKSRWLTRIYDARAEVFGRRQAEPLFFSALHPLSAWCDNAVVAEWHDQHPERTRDWRKLTLHQRAEWLPRYLADTGATLFIDDGHKLSGRKTQIARACLLSTKRWLMSTSDENRLPPNIRTVVERSNVQRTQLDSDASYDVTAVLMWCIAVLLLLAGAWEVSLVIAGLNALGAGRRSARAD